jgi:putative flippase GtrA
MTAPPLAVVIPAYQPDDCLLEVARELEPWGVPIIVVDDGSGAAFRPRFQQLARLQHVEIVEHRSNLGKGAALRSGFQLVLERYPQARGIVTADADGQHHPGDIRKIGERLLENGDALILGTRQFGASTPLRSRIGNQLTRVLYRILHGQYLKDTQTGLRGVPRRLAEAMLHSTMTGYEFELDMLIVARRGGIPLDQVDIRTVYLNDNASSHFQPLRDSMRIYYVLLRFSAVSLVTAVCDNAVFYAALSLYGHPLAAQVCARLLALFVNFHWNRRLVFQVAGSGARVWARYLSLVAASGAISYAGLMALHANLGISLFSGKLLMETSLFLINFLVQRDFVFTDPGDGRNTDWTAYYRRVPWTARLTRRYTARCLLEALDRCGLTRTPPPVLAEFGGGNSCFADAILRRFPPRAYHVVDSNPLGIELLRRRGHSILVLHAGDVREVRLPEPADVVLSVGLIEHFDHAGNSQVIAAHFGNAKPGGWVLLSFPNPTWLYRATRGLLEIAGLWRFPDERPLQREEVFAAASPFGDLAWERTLWPLLLTQHMMLFRNARGKIANGDSSSGELLNRCHRRPAN